MKVHEFYQKPLMEIINGYNIVNVNVHADANNEVRSVEIKYVPDDAPNEDAELKIPPIPNIGGRYA